MLLSINKSEHKLYLLYPFADWILNRAGLGRWLTRKSSISESMKALYNTTKPEQLQKLFWCGRISLVIMIIGIFNIFSLFSHLMYSENSILLEGKYLKRPNYGEGRQQVELNVSIQQKNASSKESRSQKVSVDIEERSYTDEELEAIYQKSFDYLKKDVLGKNKSAEKIYDKLNFCKSIPGTSITVEWEPQNNNLIEFDGRVCNEGIDKKGISTKVTAILLYRKKRAERTMSFRIMPKQYSKDEILAGKLRGELAKASEKSAKDSYLKLPGYLGDYKLSWWEGEEKSNSEMLFFLGIIMAVVAWVAGEKELEKKMKQRKEQMLLDYPELVNKFTLLVNAGMTIKQAWNKIVEDYFTKTGQTKNKKRYAYEEMLTTANELKLGKPENIAYEQYGQRIGLIPYIKFSSLISQNLKKGNKGFTDLMMKEAMEAFEERKEVAKRLGEEVGTKLLIPMMLMLIIVFMIIMIPAFMAFKI